MTERFHLSIVGSRAVAISFFFVAMVLCVATTLTGCRPTAEKAKPAAANNSNSAGEQSQYRTEILASAVNLLNSPEQFDDDSQDAAQLVERLNQWRHMSGRNQSLGDSAENVAQLDPLLKSLPENLLKLRVVRHLGDEPFDPNYDGAFLREAAILRDVAGHIDSEKQDDVSVAQALFDWTVRNIQIAPQPAADSTPAEQWVALHTPEESIYFGEATPLGRAWAFMLLARQRGLDVVLLATPDPRNPDQLRPWSTALLSDGELYLFDPTYGLPIPGPGGKGVATLAQAAADDAVLRQMDVPGDRIYPRKAADLQKVTALLEASPGYLAPRMKVMESRLTGHDRLVLSVDPSQLAEKLHGIKHVDQVKIWPLPYEVLEQRRNLPPQLQQAANLERIPFTILADPEQTSKDEQQGADHAHRRQRAVVPLRIGRLLQLRGVYGTSDRERSADKPGELSEIMENGAKYYYLRALPTQDQLDDIARMVRNHVEIAPGRSLSEEFLNAFRRKRDDAAYWLGIIAFEQGDMSTASEFFGPMTLDAFPNGPWSNGARYNLARSYEAQGKIPEAIKLYEADRSPQRYGNRLRAARLKEKSPSSPAASAEKSDSKK